jgi:glucodextranase-like protein
MTRRSTHVRRRPASSGRPIGPIKAAAPDRHRVRQHRGLDARRRPAPLVTRTLLGISVVALAAAAFLVASGGIGPVLSTLAAGFGSAIDRLVATPVPTSLDLPPTDSPRIAVPDQPYTKEETVNLSISVPIEVLGDPTAKVRIYLALEGLQAAPVRDIPVGTTSTLNVAFDLTKGRNDISATLFRGAEESDQSPIVTWFLDQEPPKITVASPKNGASIETPDATVKGSTQAGTTLIARNAGNATSINTVAARDGSFEFSLPLVPGENQIQITGTDPAGNEGRTTLKLTQGNTDMRINLRASTYRISVSHHPSSLQLTVVVTDPSGDPLAGARAFFTLQIPGLAPISNEVLTDANGRAIFTTPLFGQLEKGSGAGTVLVTHDVFGEGTDRVALTFVK